MQTEALRGEHKEQDEPAPRQPAPDRARRIQTRGTGQSPSGAGRATLRTPKALPRRAPHAPSTRIKHAARKSAVTRRPARGPASPLLVMGAILTIAGAALCTRPGEQPALYAAAALPLERELPGGVPPARADHNPAPV